MTTAEILVVIVIVAASIPRVATDCTVRERLGMVISGIAIAVAGAGLLAVSSNDDGAISPNLTSVFIAIGALLLVALRMNERGHRDLATPSVGDTSAHTG